MNYFGRFYFGWAPVDWWGKMLTSAEWGTHIHHSRFHGDGSYGHVMLLMTEALSTRSPFDLELILISSIRLFHPYSLFKTGKIVNIFKQILHFYTILIKKILHMNVVFSFFFQMNFCCWSDVFLHLHLTLLTKEGLVYVILHLHHHIIHKLVSTYNSSFDINVWEHLSLSGPFYMSDAT